MKFRFVSLCQGLFLASALGISATAWADDDCERVDSFTTVLVNGDQADVYHPIPARPGTPSIAVLQGANVDKSLYAGFARELACAGYNVVVPNHFAALFPGGTPQLFSSQQVINAVLATMIAANTHPGSPLFGTVDTNKLGASGHSFGGAAAVFAATGTCTFPFCFGFYARPPQLKAVAVYGVNTYNNTPGGGRTLIDVNTAAVPVVLLQGSLDGKSVPSEAADTFAILEAPKGLITFDGLNHWGINDVQIPGAIPPEPNAQTRSQSWGISKTAKYARIVFDAYVKGSGSALKKLRRGNAENGVTIQFAE